LEIDIIHELQEIALNYVNPLLEMDRVSSQLDCILSLAEAAKKYNYHRPTITEENTLIIKDGRFVFSLFFFLLLFLFKKKKKNSI